jgi:hypothetical protein
LGSAGQVQTAQAQQAAESLILEQTVWQSAGSQTWRELIARILTAEGINR